MPERRSRRLLDQPRVGRSPGFIPRRGAFARISERTARFLGTGRYLAIQTIFVVIWIALNVAAIGWQFDPYPFILLNLVFSIQAAYAAPLILLAQNSQDDRDRTVLAQDREQSERTKADTEYLARELAALRIAVGGAITRDYLRGEVDTLAARLPAVVDGRIGQSGNRPSGSGGIPRTGRGR
jgi:uncharacterized membrane protein